MHKNVINLELSSSIEGCCFRSHQSASGRNIGQQSLELGEIKKKQKKTLYVGLFNSWLVIYLHRPTALNAEQRP